jgi:mannan endo-1,4-beta-mannosidase
MRRLLCAFAVLASGCSVQPAATTTGSPVATPSPSAVATHVPTLPDVVARNGTHLQINGSDVHLLGYDIPWIGAKCKGWSQTEAAAVFADIATNSRGTVVRAGMYQGGAQLGTATPWQQFDMYVDEARKQGLRVLPVLTNTWESCEPTSRKHFDWYAGTGGAPPGYKVAGDGVNDGQTVSYRDYVKMFAAHYAQNATIAWYQLVNEPDARNADGSCSSSNAVSAMKAFANDMVATIRSVDADHMVDFGSISWCGGEGADFGAVMSSNVDICDVYHDYGSPAVTVPDDALRRLNQCSHLNKPSFVGEAGIHDDVDRAGSRTGRASGATLLNRARFFGAKISAGFGAGMVAYLIWDKGVQATLMDHAGTLSVGTCPGSSGCATDPTATVMALAASPQ